MPSAFKTPGIYVNEPNAFPNSIVEVATAVPVFIGHTEKADNKGMSLGGKPWRICSLSEYISFFGQGARDLFELDTNGVALRQTPVYRMFQALHLFFQNGGGPCYIVSIGGYEDACQSDGFVAALAAIEKEQEPTLVVIPEAVSLASAEDCAKVQNASIEHCAKMGNRLAILDVYEGFKEPEECIGAFRSSITSSRLDLAASYYPWLRTTLHTPIDATFENVANLDVLKQILADTIRPTPDMTADGSRNADLAKEIAKLGTTLPPADASALHKLLLAAIPRYGQILNELGEQLNLFPPSAAMAGIYAMVDNSRGVWKAPANVGMNGVVAPAVQITADAQESLNVPSDGKAINAIRTFVGEGVLVWGARTMDGNSMDWRYINVRRTLIMLEQSIRLAASAYVFEPNVANTWVTLKAMISSFLTSIWKRGGLAGAIPNDAFSVHVGLGETMTAQDILDGNLRLTVFVALSRPAEFIQISFEQQMQKP